MRKISLIHRKVSLLDGICPEVVQMLKEQHFSASLGTVLRKMKSTRQIECVELMLTANNMTVAYAEALLAATSPQVLIAVEAWSAHLARRYCPIWMNEVRNRGSFASRRAACCMFLMIIPSI